MKLLLNKGMIREENRFSKYKMRGIYGNLQFFYADESLNDIASELDSFDGRRDPERCNVLVNKLRVAQDRVLHIISQFLSLSPHF